jgi:peptide/nickel transport system substrate-binding protein
MTRLLALFVAIVLCAPPALAQNILRIGVGQGLVDADPHTSTLYSDVRILEQVYQSLMRTDPHTGEPIPDLAESMVPAADGMSWTVKLRPGVTFHDGQPFTSADAKWSLDRIRDPATTATLRSDLAPIQEIVAQDPLTLVIKLKQPYSILPRILSSQAWAAMVPANSTNLRAKPVGTGPFTFVNAVPQTSVTLRRFEHYRDTGLPKLDGVQFTVIPDESARLAALTSQQVDMIDTVSLAQASQLKKATGVRLLQYDSSWIDEFGMNTQRKPFDDPRVRRAIAMAINRDDVLQAATFGLGKPAATMVPTSSPVKVDVPAIPYAPDQARALLREAGVGDFSFSFAPCGGTSFPQLDRAAEVIAEDLKQIGITAQVTTMEASVWVDRVINRHDYDAFVCGLINGIDPDQKTFRYFSRTGSYNFSQYKPPARVDQLLQQGREVSDPAQRKAIYEEVWRLILQDSPWVPLYQMPGLIGISQRVQGLQVTPISDLVLIDVSLAR